MPETGPITRYHIIDLTFAFCPGSIPMGVHGDRSVHGPPPVRGDRTFHAPPHGDISFHGPPPVPLHHPFEGGLREHTRMVDEGILRGFPAGSRIREGGAGPGLVGAGRHREPSSRIVDEGILRGFPAGSRIVGGGTRVSDAPMSSSSFRMGSAPPLLGAMPTRSPIRKLPLSRFPANLESDLWRGSEKSKKRCWCRTSQTFSRMCTFYPRTEETDCARALYHSRPSRPACAWAGLEDDGPTTWTDWTKHADRRTGHPNSSSASLTRRIGSALFLECPDARACYQTPCFGKVVFGG